MAQIDKKVKPLAVSPLKVSQPVGASLAFLGLARSMPLFHGSQGCTAFAKVLFVRHFREPIPLQTTAMEQVSTVMGADDNIVEALRAIASKQKPTIIGLLTTGLSETQGADIVRAVRRFRDDYPEFEEVAVVPVNTPDYVGGLESGYAAAVRATIDTLVPPAAEAGTRPGLRRRQVNVLAGPSLTPGDIEALKALLEAFDLRPVVLPDLADSLDGHLAPDDFNPLTTGGTPRSEIAHLGDALATLVIGRSLEKAANLLHERTGVPDYRFGALTGLEANDRLLMTLSEIAERPVPPRLEREREQLQDAMLDCHFMLGQRRVAVAAEPEGLLALAQLLQPVGAQVVAAVAPSRSDALGELPLETVRVGDLEDLERLASEGGAELVMGNSHTAASAERLGIPLLRYGFPQYDRVGGHQRTWIGYRGTRQALFDLANLMLEHGQHEIEPYRSIYKQDSEVGHGPAAAASCA